MTIWSIKYGILLVVFVCSVLIAILEYLRQRGNATRQRWTLIAAILAFTLLVANLAHDWYEVSSSRRATERFEQVVATFEVSVPGNAPGLEAYRDRLRSAAERCLQKANAPNGTIQTEDPICLPDSTKEPVASAVLSASVLFLDFFQAHSSGCGEPPSLPADLKMELPVSIPDRTLTLIYDRQQDVFLLTGRLGLPAAKWTSPSGNIIAPGDLPGTEMVASVQGLGIYAHAKEVYRSMELRYLELTLSGTRTFVRQLRQQLQRLGRGSGYPTYSYCF